MIRDIIRAVLAVLVMSVAAGLLIEVRFNLAAIDVAHRQATAGAVTQAAYQPPAEPGRLRRFGGAALNLADAALGVIR